MAVLWALAVALVLALSGCSSTGEPASGASPPPASASVAGATATTSTTPPAAAPVRSFTIAATGDFLAHTPVVRRAAAHGAESGQDYDFRPLLAGVAPIIRSADLAVCHLETPLSTDDSRLSSYPLFNVPHELAGAIAEAGYDACSTASNHTIDQGAAGAFATLEALDAAGVRHAGTARSPIEAATPKIYEVAGVRVGHLSYTYGLNGLALPADKPWLVGLIEPERILADARATRAAGAEFVVVSLHWGIEYHSEPTPEQRDVARKLLAAPEIDLILGHHAHVVQPIEKLGSKYVVYGMGNFLSAQHQRPATRDGLIVLVTVSGQPGAYAVSGISYVPTLVERPSYRVVPASPGAGETGASWARTTRIVESLGAPAVAVARAG